MTLIKNHIYQYLHGPAVKKCQVPMFFKYLLLLPLILHLNQRLATFIKMTAQLKKRSRPTFIQNLVFFVDTLIGTIRWSQLSPPPSSTRPQVVFCSLLFKKLIQPKIIKSYCSWWIRSMTNTTTTTNASTTQLAEVHSTDKQINK